MSYKLEKVNELIKQELGKIIFAQEEFGPGVMVTLMAVKTSPDLRDAAVTFSVLPTQKGKPVLKKLSADASNLRRLLTKKLRMHPVPIIRFVLDETETESQKIDMLIEKIKPH